ncbi:hypothetical protein EBS40_09915, partial [bacterium]|nr:hypothetical protein [bacterium]
MATPLTVKEALSGPQKHLWKPSMEEESQAMVDSGVWDPQPVELPPGKNVVDTKWVFRVKRDQDGRISRYKSRLVARGFTQEKGIDYTETFSCVAKWGTVRLFMAVAPVKGWLIEVVDVDTAFLNAPLEEEVYLKPPEGLNMPKGKVLRLRRALYGLKQAPRTWEKQLGEFLESKGFKRSSTDRALYYRFEKEDFIFIPIYVDDLLLVSNRDVQIQQVKKELEEQFTLKIMGEVNSYLGVKISRDWKNKNIALSLPQHTSELEKRFEGYLKDKKTSKVLGSPMIPEMMKELKLPEGEWKPEDREQVDRYEYMRMLGSLMFAALTCRPDLAYSVSLLSQAGQDPRHIHMQALIRVLQYLVDNKDLQLVYRGATGSIQPCIFTDSDWG